MPCSGATGSNPSRWSARRHRRPRRRVPGPPVTLPAAALADSPHCPVLRGPKHLWGGTMMRLDSGCPRAGRRRGEGVPYTVHPRGISRPHGDSARLRLGVAQQALDAVVVRRVKRPGQRLGAPGGAAAKSPARGRAGRSGRRRRRAERPRWQGHLRQHGWTVREQGDLQTATELAVQAADMARGQTRGWTSAPRRPVAYPPLPLRLRRGRDGRQRRGALVPQQTECLTQGHSEEG